MTENPYKSPTSALASPTVRWNAGRLAFAAINFSVAGCIFAACIAAIANPQSPGSLMGGLGGFVPVSVYWLCEWLAFYRRSDTMERKLAYANLCGAAFAVFGIVANILEGFASGGLANKTTVLFWIVVIGGSITLYLALCGWLRLRWTSQASRDEVAVCDAT